MSKIVQTHYSSDDNSIYRLVLEPKYNAMLTLCHLQKDEELSNNENFSSYRASGDIPVTGIVYIDSNPAEHDIKKIGNSYEPHMVLETYEKYINKLEDLDSTNLAWIQKIIDGSNEQEKVLERNDEFLIVRDWKFDVRLDENSNALYKKEDLHLLGILVKNVKSLRDIVVTDIFILEKMKEKLLQICEQVFGLNRDEVKLYFHYPPSTYHLHLHCVWICCDDPTVNFERAYDYDTVIRNIRMDPTYYQNTMKYVCYHR